MASLLISPVLGFLLAAGLYLIVKRLANNPRLEQPPVDDEPPPPWIRAVLVGTCSAVSMAHGSNDGQKGVGLIMLILIGLLPARFASTPTLVPSKPSRPSTRPAASNGCWPAGRRSSTMAISACVQLLDDVRKTLAGFPQAS